MWRRVASRIMIITEGDAKVLRGLPTLDAKKKAVFMNCFDRFIL